MSWRLGRSKPMLIEWVVCFVKHQIEDMAFTRYGVTPHDAVLDGDMAQLANSRKIVHLFIYMPHLIHILIEKYYLCKKEFLG